MVKFLDVKINPTNVFIVQELMVSFFEIKRIRSKLSFQKFMVFRTLPDFFSNLNFLTFCKYNLQDADLDCVLENTRNLGMEHTRLFSYQLLRAVKFIHSAFIIHRDIQLTNVLVNVDTLMLKVNSLFQT